MDLEAKKTEKSSFTVTVNGQEVHGPRKYLIGAVMGIAGIVIMLFGMFILAGGMVFLALAVGAVMIISALIAGVAGLLGGHGSHR